jgi:hypothetical protein
MTIAIIIVITHSTKNDTLIMLSKKTEDRDYPFSLQFKEMRVNKLNDIISTELGHSLDKSEDITYSPEEGKRPSKVYIPIIVTPSMSGTCSSNIMPKSTKSFCQIVVYVAIFS